MLFDENNNYFDIVNSDYNYNYHFKKYIDKSKEFNNDLDIDINIDSINFNRNNDLNTALDGFNMGNMYKNLYSKYKNHSYKLKVFNKKDELLYKIQMYSFAMKDLNLYLDLHPTDKDSLNMFYEYRKKYNDYKKQYENVYHPLNIMDVQNNDKWTWIDNPWPWDFGGKESV